MLEHVPKAIGVALRGIGPGLGKLTANKTFAGVRQSIKVESDAFAPGSPIPDRHTADGPGLSPPLAWRGVPADAAMAVLVIEDADSPTPEPVVHGLVLDLAGRDGALSVGALKSSAGAGEPHVLGKNSFLQTLYLPPDPPRGHGPHRYAFQVFALDKAVAFDTGTGRGAMIEAMREHVIAKGVLIGTYERR